MAELTHEKLRDYRQFRDLVSRARAAVDPSLSFKRFDMGMWIIGKHLFDKRPSENDKQADREFRRRIRVKLV